MGGDITQQGEKHRDAKFYVIGDTLIQESIGNEDSNGSKNATKQ